MIDWHTQVSQARFGTSMHVNVLFPENMEGVKSLVSSGVVSDNHDPTSRDVVIRKES